MTAEARRRRNAVRLVRALQKVGATFALVHWQAFLLIGVRLTPKTRRRLKSLEPEVLEVLQQIAIEAAVRGQMPVVLPESDGKRHGISSTIH